MLVQLDFGQAAEASFDFHAGFYPRPFTSSLHGGSIGPSTLLKARLLPETPLEAWLRTRVKDVAGDAALRAAELLAEGATVPFVARYRKDETSGLDEAALRRVVAAREVFERMEARRAAILDVAERQKKRTPDLEERLAAAVDLATLEDLFQPFRKKKGPTVAAREAGLEPLADWIWATGHGTEMPQEGQTLELWAFTYRNPEKGVGDAAAAIAGSQALLVERLAEDADLRALVRREVAEKGVVLVTKADKAKAGSKHEALFGFKEKAATLRESASAPRVFALRRAAHEGDVALSVVPPDGDGAMKERLLAAFEGAALSLPSPPGALVLKEAAREALEKHVWPDAAAELLQAIREDADRTAIRLLAETARRRFMTPPLGPKAVLGVHPTKDGGVVALVDAYGRFVKGGRFTLAPEERAEEGRQVLPALAREGEVFGVAVGDATAGRERALFVEEALGSESFAVVQVLSEAVAAAWRTSEAAQKELPDLDAETRSAVSLARRLQDPLAELLKAEARNLAEGPYLHEVSQRLLARRLGQTLESCLHDTGVDVNHASAVVLSAISGLGEEQAKAIVLHRDTNGPFPSRQALRAVAGLDPKAFEQAAGFLYVRESANPLDATRVHPERYLALEAFASREGKPLGEFFGEGASRLRDDAALKDGLGPRTLDDVVRELGAPARDPRGAFVPFRYRPDLRRLEDLKPGLVCPGIVTNVATFGAFVDVGVPHDGLVHVSQLPPRDAGDPRQALLPGDRVEVRVVKVDLEKKQISLSMRTAAPRPPSRPAGARRPSPEARATTVATRAHGPSPRPLRVRAARRAGPRAHGRPPVRPHRRSRASRARGPSRAGARIAPRHDPSVRLRAPNGRARSRAPPSTTPSLSWPSSRSRRRTDPARRRGALG